MKNTAILTEWHRRRRQGSSLQLEDSQPQSSADLSLPLLLPSPSDNFPFSPLTCPSPAGFFREEVIRKNVHQVRAEYEFERCLGKGSFGEVHLATHRRTGLQRAVKELEKSGTETEEFEWELQALVALDHPHIVKLIEYFDDEDQYYLVTELCTGPDLSNYIIERIEDPDGPGYVPERDVSVILRQCLKSVLCCHAHGFIHRDLNAKNFMFTGADRTVKLIDFGLATRFLGYVPQDKFIEIVGTSHYMAPEMMLHGEYSPAVDMWGLGVLLYVLLTGLMLLPKDDDKKMRLLKKPGYVLKLLQNSKFLQKRSVSTNARGLLEKMLQQDPGKRITASEALLHPFVLGYSHDHIGAEVEHTFIFNEEFISRFRSFGKAPRLKKVALLTMAHLAEHEKELVGARHAFRTMDRDGDGSITLDEFKECLAENGVEAPADLGEVFAACDSSCSGMLTLVDFVACLLPRTHVDERLCHEAFNILDTESKGWLSAADLQAVFRSYDLQRCEKMVSQAAPGKSTFNFEDFHRFLCCDETPVEPPRKVARLECDTAQKSIDGV